MFGLLCESIYLYIQMIDISTNVYGQILKEKRETNENECLHEPKMCLFDLQNSWEISLKALNVCTYCPLNYHLIALM